MTGDIQDYVSQFQLLINTKGTTYQSRRELKLFFATELFSFITLDLLGALPESKTGHEHIIVITY